MFAIGYIDAITEFQHSVNTKTVSIFFLIIKFYPIEACKKIN